MDELHACRLRYRGHAINGLADDIRQLNGAKGERLAPALDAFKIENVVDEPDQAVGVGEGNAEQIGSFFINVAEDAGGEQAKGSADGGKGRAQFVTDGGNELVFEAVQGVALTDVAETKDRAGKAALIEDRC